MSESAEVDTAQIRRDLDAAIAAALPLAGGRVRIALLKLRMELGLLDDQRVGTAAREKTWLRRQGVLHTHACVTCSPDGEEKGPGCINCRQTGMDQTPCGSPGHFRSCPSGCCEQGGEDRG